MQRKPRLGNQLFLGLDKANGHIFHDKNGSNVIAFEKGPSWQETIVPRFKRQFLQDKSTLHGSSHGYKAYNDASKAGDTIRSLHKRDKQRELSESGYENASTRETSHESTESFDTFGNAIKQNAIVQKRRCSVHTKDLNQLVRDGRTDKARCKPDTPNQTPKKRGNAISRFLDDDIDEDTCIGQGDNEVASRGYHSSKNVCNKYAMEHSSRAKLGPDMHAASHCKPLPKRLENKTIRVVGKKSPTSKVDGITYRLHSGEGARSLRRMESKKGSDKIVIPIMESPYIPEARRQARYTYAQETSDNEDTHRNGQSSSESELNMHGYHGFTPRTSNVNDREGLQVPTLRKSSRVPKKRIFDGDEEEPMRRQRKKLEVEPAADYSVNVEQDEAAGDENDLLEREYHKSKEISVSYADEKKELPLTARQRSLRISKEGGDPEAGTNVDFPDGLQPVLPRKQKENLNEAEQAIKKEEAARRRKQQMERNAKEIQASAIQKILGQESSRKKREEKLQKQRQEIEQEKQAASMAPAVNSIRWVMGPSGNVVSFSQDVELPEIFSGPCSYPQAREKCAGPSCNNAYKYRHSKTRLPLCSLQCYRAVQELPSSGPAF